jgi:S1-C subfamily serine protease
MPPNATEPPAGADDDAAPNEQALADTMKTAEFQRFVDAQLTWDRAMAEALASAKTKFSGATIVGIVGSGHVAEGFGIPHQLQDLKVDGVASLIPESIDTACKRLGTRYADAIFTLPTETARPPEPQRPLLGIQLGDSEGSVKVNRVVPDSVAAATGLKEGDRITRAAGLDIRTTDELIEVVGRQAPGTWLPLSIRRDDQELEMVAKFPPRPR